MSVLVPVQVLTGMGGAPTFTAAAAAGNHFLNNGRVRLEFVNAHTAAITITINSITPCSQGFDHDFVITVPNGTRWKVPALEPSRFNNTTGHVTITYSLVTALTLAVVEV